MRSMIFSFAALFASLAVVSADCQSGSTAHVRVIVKTPSKTIYDGLVNTSGHDITKPSSNGTHCCNGLNNHANPHPGATCTTALDAASGAGGFTWDAKFYPSLDDFFITTIAGYSGSATNAWLIYLDSVKVNVGGCQQEIKDNQVVTWSYEAITPGFAEHILETSGPQVARGGEPVVYQVINRKTGKPVCGATIGGVVTDSDGKATIVFPKAGGQTVLHAEDLDGARSNSIIIHVM